MALCEKVIRCEQAALDVVHRHGVGIDTSWFAVDEDDRETSAQITGQVVLARGGRDDDETIDATLHERVD